MTPLGKRVLLEVEPAAVKLGAIHIPDVAQRRPQEGKVIACGPDVQAVKPGDRVLFSRGSISEAGPYWIAWESALMAVLE